jgi:hypothetical protein
VVPQVAGVAPAGLGGHALGHQLGAGGVEGLHELRFALEHAICHACRCDD